MKRLGILNHLSIPKEVPVGCEIEIPVESISFLKELDDVEFLEDDSKRFFDYVKPLLPFAQKKRRGQGQWFYLIPTPYQVSKKMQRDYVAFYGNTYA